MKILVNSCTRLLPLPQAVLKIGERMKMLVDSCKMDLDRKERVKMLVYLCIRDLDSDERVKMLVD